MSQPHVPDHGDPIVPPTVPPTGPAAGPPPAGAGSQRSWWPVLLAAVAALVVGAAGGVGVAALAGGDGGGGSESERFARGACQALDDWELTDGELTIVAGDAPEFSGVIAASGYGMAAGLTDDEFHEFEQAGLHMQRALHQFDEDGLAEAANRLADACADHGF